MLRYLRMNSNISIFYFSTWCLGRLTWNKHLWKENLTLFRPGIFYLLKRTSGRRKGKLKWKSVKNAKKSTSHHRPQCVRWFSRYSISKSGIRARWTSPFCRFSASFSIKYDVTDAILQDNEKMKVQYLRSLLFDLFETLQPVRTWQRNFASFQILLLWQPESKLLSIIEKQKVYCLSKSDVRKVIWNNTVWLLLQAVSSFEEKCVIYFSYCEKTIVFCFWIKANYSRLSCHNNEI